MFDEDIGPLVKHVYEVFFSTLSSTVTRRSYLQIKSEAESQMTGLYVDIYWPSLLAEDPSKHLLYLIDKPVGKSAICNRPRGNCVTCRAQQPQLVNPLNLKVSVRFLQYPLVILEYPRACR